RFSPPFTEVSSERHAEILAEINCREPDILWVGLGSPKQDFWMKENRDKLTAPVMVGVGAAFDFISGTKKQAPKWMQRSGLEWFFRLCCEPRRLWKRYLVGNSKFIFFLLRDWWRGASLKQKRESDVSG
ncbi:MAG: WecB/TagA/CpsF family glycosyltransferase, partial [Candidatus Omnitrophota bacterium]